MSSQLERHRILEGMILSSATHSLHEALINLSTATDSRGLLVALVGNPRSVSGCRRALQNMARWFQPDSEWLGDEGEMNATRNLFLVAEALRALLAYRAAGGGEWVP